MKTMQVKTPVFKGANATAARLTGTAEGFIDAAKVVGVTSGLTSVESAEDRRKDGGREVRSGNMFTLLTFDGGAQLLVMGNPKGVFEEVQKTLGDAPAVQSEDSDGNGVETQAS